MNEDCAKHFIMALQREYGRPFAIDGLKIIKPALLRESDHAMEGAYNWIIGNVPKPHLPSPNKLLEIVQIEGKKIIMTEAKKNDEQEKETVKQSPDIFQYNPKSQIGQDSMLIIKAILTEEPDYPTIIEGIRHLDNTYPRAGFGLVGAKIQTDWQAKGYI